MTHKAPLIGELKARRHKLGLSLSELGERCAIEERFLHDWERGVGSPRLDAIESWAAALGLRFSLTESGQEAPPRGLSIDRLGGRVSLDGKPVRLTPMEWKALERLAAAPGELVTHAALFRHLYGEERSYSARSTAIRVLITKLRRLLPLRIEAQWGRGYLIHGIEPAAKAIVADVVAPAATAATAAVVTVGTRPVDNHSERGCREGSAAGSQPMAQKSAPHGPIGLLRALAENGGNSIQRPAGRRPPPSPITVAAPAAAPHRAEELRVIERFLAERGATRCPDVAAIEHAPLPGLVWDKVKRKWVRPGLTERTVN